MKRKFATLYFDETAGEGRVVFHARILRNPKCIYSAVGDKVVGANAMMQLDILKDCIAILQDKYKEAGKYL